MLANTCLKRHGRLSNSRKTVSIATTIFAKSTPFDRPDKLSNSGFQFEIVITSSNAREMQRLGWEVRRANERLRSALAPFGLWDAGNARPYSRKFKRALEGRLELPLPCDDPLLLMLSALRTGLGSGSQRNRMWAAKAFIRILLAN